MARWQNLGDRSGFWIRYKWHHEKPTQNPARSTRAALLIGVEDTPIWGNPVASKEDHFQWPWIELLEFLGHSWYFIQYEQGYPCGLNPEWPSKLRSLSSRSWNNLPEEQRIALESELYAFEENHNLANAVHGASFPPFWLVREGNVFRVGTTNQTKTVRVGPVLDSLSQLCEKLKARIHHISDERAQSIIDLWDNRENITLDTFAEISTGLKRESLGQIAGSKSLEEVLELRRGTLFMNEITTAARMVSGTQSAIQISRILGAIREIPLLDYGKVNQLAARAKEQLSKFKNHAPFAQGYALANWLRQQQETKYRGAAVDLDETLKGLGVFLNEENLETKDVDALACWGDRHGPGIVLNKIGLHSSNLRGKRATLGHELCHLLVDRDDALPLAEVLGGVIPIRAEQRAKAFSAEFLAPRSDVARIAKDMLQDPEIDGQGRRKYTAIIRSICKEYMISKSVAVWQLLHSNELLPLDARGFRRYALPEYSKA
jgi:Zn-dependent peptidase ImmA (M78 family)